MVTERTLRECNACRIIGKFYIRSISVSTLIVFNYKFLPQILRHKPLSFQTIFSEHSDSYHRNYFPAKASCGLTISQLRQLHHSTPYTLSLRLSKDTCACISWNFWLLAFLVTIVGQDPCTCKHYIVFQQIFITFRDIPGK